MKVKNVLEDGTVLNSMKGVVIPADISDKLIAIILRSEKDKIKRGTEGAKP